MHIAPKTARQARLLRLITAQQASEGAKPMGDAERMVWVNSHVRRQQDKVLSQRESVHQLRNLPTTITNANNMANYQLNRGSVFHYREFPMYPGEYVPAGHNTLSSLRDELREDLTAQSLKEAWMRVGGAGSFPQSTSKFFQRADGLDEEQLAEIVGALLPSLATKQDAHGLVTRLLETISTGDDTTNTRRLNQTIAAESVGLDDAPQHYTNFLEWMGRIMNTKAFQTEHAIFQFCRRKFNRKDVRIMNENLKTLGTAALQEDMADGYSHFHHVLKDFSVKIAAKDTRHQVGVRIDPQEVDEKTGFAFGHGLFMGKDVVCILRENKDGTGKIFAQGKPLNEFMFDRAWMMELILMAFDEANVNYKDFDVYLKLNSSETPRAGGSNFARASRLAIANALTKMLPITRIGLKKAGLLSMDRRRRMGVHPGFVNGKTKNRFFQKR